MGSMSWEYSSLWQLCCGLTSLPSFLYFLNYSYSVKVKLYVSYGYVKAPAHIDRCLFKHVMSWEQTKSVNGWCGLAYNITLLEATWNFFLLFCGAWPGSTVLTLGILIQMEFSDALQLFWKSWNVVVVCQFFSYEFFMIKFCILMKFIGKLTDLGNILSKLTLTQKDKYCS